MLRWNRHTQRHTHICTQRFGHKSLALPSALSWLRNDLICRRATSMRRWWGRFTHWWCRRCRWQCMKYAWWASFRILLFFTFCIFLSFLAAKRPVSSNNNSYINNNNNNNSFVAFVRRAWTTNIKSAQLRPAVLSMWEHP